jgi:hypothetical protein
MKYLKSLFAFTLIACAALYSCGRGQDAPQDAKWAQLKPLYEEAAKAFTDSSKSIGKAADAAAFVAALDALGKELEGVQTKLYAAKTALGDFDAGALASYLQPQQDQLAAALKALTLAIDSKRDFLNTKEGNDALNRLESEQAALIERLQ